MLSHSPRTLERRTIPDFPISGTSCSAHFEIHSRGTRKASITHSELLQDKMPRTFGSPDGHMHSHLPGTLVEEHHLKTSEPPGQVVLHFVEIHCGQSRKARPLQISPCHPLHGDEASMVHRRQWLAVVKDCVATWGAGQTKQQGGKDSRQRGVWARCAQYISLFASLALLSVHACAPTHGATGTDMICADRDYQLWSSRSTTQPQQQPLGSCCRVHADSTQ